MNTWAGLFRPRRSTRGWLLAAAGLAMLTLICGALLLGVAGWLIAASAMAGIGLITMIDIFAPGAAIRALAVGRTVSRYLERLIGHEATLRQLTELRVVSFENLLRRPERELDALRKGDALTRLTTDIDTLDHLFPRFVLPSIAALVITLLAAVGYGLVDLRLGLITLLMFGLLMPLVLAVAGLRARGPGRALALAGPRLRTLLAETIRGIRELKTIGRIQHRFADIQRQAGEVIGLQLRLRRIEALAHGAIVMIGLTAVWLLLLAAVQLHGLGVLNAPVMILIVLSAMALIDAWTPLANGWSFIETCRRAAARLDDLAPPAGARDSGITDPVQTRSRSLCARGLVFRYQPWGDPILDDLNLELQPGKRIVITGDSGCGKTTLGKVLAGLLPATEGQVRFAGVDLQRIGRHELRSRIGYLPQQPVLFHDTLAANLRLARPEAADDELYEVLTRVRLDCFFDQLPDGLDTWIGESGTSISGGEARRLSLARLMLVDYDVLILDEPTAGLDADTAAAVAERIEPWLRGRSLVMLSHDRRRLPAHDRVLYFEQGRLREHRAIGL